MKSLRILVADDNHTDRLILSAIVKKEGHEVITAENGEQAVKQFEAHHPDIILMDALMPVMDGFEAARTIKSRLTNELVPIIFLTSLQDADSLARCLESGGDDFLSKPYNRVILKAKINAFSRMRRMHSQIQEHNRQLILEQQVAKRVFDNVAQKGDKDDPSLRASLSPMAVFNGDTVLSHRRPDGGLHVFVGDFTGHGLPAAIGALPLAETFYGMTAKGFSLEEIVREINQKLCNILPSGIFCCGGMVHVDYNEHSVHAWCGGLPTGFLLRTDGTMVEIPSTGVPLGIIGSGKYPLKVQRLPVSEGDRVFMWSDGIIEATNASDAMFGEERLIEIVSSAKDNSKVFDQILAEVYGFIGDSDRSDDITMAEILVHQKCPVQQHDTIGSTGASSPQAWSIDLHFDSSTLQQYNPLPLFLHLLTEVDQLKSYSGQLYTLLSELYSNALDHGLLGLDSSLKHSAEGFANYYATREQRLQNLNDAFIRVEMRFEPRDRRNGTLFLNVEDNGSGFDFESVLNAERTNLEYSGRGLPLIRKLARKLQYLGNGNRVELEIDWPIEEH